MLQNVLDEVLSGDPKYTLRDSNNNILYDDVDITMKTPVTREGTPINRALLRNLQGDVYTASQYTKPSRANNAMTLNLPLTSYETGKIINIISPATFSSYPTLNISGLGAKTVNSMLVLDKKYSLIYNGTSFDVISNDVKDIFYTTTNSGSNFSVNIPINSYETNMIIKIKASANASAPTLNVNGLGIKTVNTNFIANKEYILIYNGTSWDSFSSAQIITESGNYSLLHSKYYCVAIGGGGGAGRGGGTSGRNALGGDGGLVAGIFTPTSSTTAITIGAGGSTSTTGGSQAGAGGNTQIGFLIAYGGKGGKGGTSSSTAPTPGEGGSGAGGAVLQGITPVQESSGTVVVAPTGHTVEGVTYGQGGTIDTNPTAGHPGAVILYPLL